MEVIDLGRRGYKEVWELQLQVHKDRVAGRAGDTLILVEHDPVVTIGRSGSIKNLLIPEAELKKRGIELYRIERGGDITYHGPGQLVGYPIFEIKRGFAGIRPFIRMIERVIGKVLADFGIEAEPGPHPGLWVEDRKILSIGIAVRSWVSFHGFALNVNNRAQDFAIINPCGHAGMVMTSMQEVLGRMLDWEAVKSGVISHFQAELA
ncbi:lipoyl(octanoyl) transferase [candidate division WOR-3 bacterium]|uniref:Octanoyltransferase n=1 Tax=candidate division WOR-3 bacterium TaxID=2052148 RepID=A0A660SLB7_UNCW3|nr:MAG: lipoyl(octanoyl) transferase [candidate division WOR-3 bacterium]